MPEDLFFQLYSGQLIPTLSTHMYVFLEKT